MWKLFSYNLFRTQFVFRKWLYITYHFIYISLFLCENNKVPLSLHFLNLKAFNTTTLNLLFVTLWAVIVRICTSKILAVVSPTRLCTCDGEHDPTRNTTVWTVATITTNSFYIWQIVTRLWTQCCNRHIASRSRCSQGTTCCCGSRKPSLATWVYQVLAVMLEHNTVIAINKSKF